MKKFCTSKNTLSAVAATCSMLGICAGSGSAFSQDNDNMNSIDMIIRDGTGGGGATDATVTIGGTHYITADTTGSAGPQDVTLTMTYSVECTTGTDRVWCAGTIHRLSDGAWLADLFTQGVCSGESGPITASFGKSLCTAGQTAAFNFACMNQETGIGTAWGIGQTAQVTCQ